MLQYGSFPGDSELALLLSHSGPRKGANNALAHGMQLYVLLLECYSDRSEWKLGLNAVGEALQCIPREFQVTDRGGAL